MRRIGIPGWMLGENGFGVKASYLEFIERFGTPIIITPRECEEPPMVDMILMPGGSDILPTSYDAVPSYRTLKPNIYLEHFDAKTLPQYIERKTPIFAICRGMQKLWTMFGGQLEQHNKWHDQSKNDYDQCHELEFTKGYEHFDKLIKKVTSRHHQCADASVFIPEELSVIAYTKESGKWYRQVVEIFEHKTLPIFGVQFHPEDHDASDELSPTVIKKYLEIG